MIINKVKHCKQKYHSIDLNVSTDKTTITKIMKIINKNKTVCKDNDCLDDKYFLEINVFDDTFYNFIITDDCSKPIYNGLECLNYKEQLLFNFYYKKSNKNVIYCFEEINRETFIIDVVEMLKISFILLGNKDS